VSRCQENSPPYRTYAASPQPFQAFNYAPHIVTSSPIAEVTFTGPTNYVCRAGADEGGAWFEGCQTV
jgi:hypothetical protein